MKHHFRVAHTSPAFDEPIKVHDISLSKSEDSQKFEIKVDGYTIIELFWNTDDGLLRSRLVANGLGSKLSEIGVKESPALTGKIML